MFRFTYNTLVYGHEPISRGIERLARFGYDGVEFKGEPQMFNSSDILALLQENQMVASSVVSIFTPERDLVSSDAHIRTLAQRYLDEVIDFASDIGAGVVTFSPTACMKISPEVSMDQEWEWAILAAKRAAEHAEQYDITIAVEPWNRYETYLINRGEQALDFVEKVDAPNVGVMLDTFHMAIEEQDLVQAIYNVGKKLVHLHLADNNRAAPGQGCLDFESILKAVVDIDYAGWISYELLPAAGDVWSVLSDSSAEVFLDPYTESSIANTKSILKELGYE